MDEINELIQKIEDKDIENSKFEIEQNELQGRCETNREMYWSKI